MEDVTPLWRQALVGARVEEGPWTPLPTHLPSLPWPLLSTAPTPGLHVPLLSAHSSPQGPMKI